MEVYIKTPLFDKKTEKVRKEYYYNNITTIIKYSYTFFLNQHKTN